MSRRRKPPRKPSRQERLHPPPSPVQAARPPPAAAPLPFRWRRSSIIAACVAIALATCAIAYVLETRLAKPRTSEAVPSTAVPRSSAVEPATAQPNAPQPGAPATTLAAFVGSEACAQCHAAEVKAWAGSHHALAMQHANDKTVLGNFADAEFSYGDVTSRFFKRGESFMVRTDGPDGSLQDYEVKFTFGVAPLQQYLLELPGGRLQALQIAWDSRPQTAGGQRWFHLYPGQDIAHGDPLHWTGLQQNWNFMCAECHTTNLQRNFDSATQSYHTSFSEIGVS